MALTLTQYYKQAKKKGSKLSFKQIKTEYEAANAKGNTITAAPAVDTSYQQKGTSATSQGRNFLLPGAIANAKPASSISSVSINAPTSMPVDPLANMTITDRAKAEIEGNYQDLYDYGSELFGDDNPYEKSALEEGVDADFATRKAKELSKKQAAEMDYLKQQQERQNFLDEAAYGRFHDQATSAIDATNEAFAQSREGITSASAPMVAKQYATEMGKQINEANTRLQMAQAQRDKIRADLQEAQKQGKEKLIEALSMQLSNAENIVRAADSEYLNSLSQATQDALDIQKQAAANLTTFTGIVDSGANLDVSSLMGLSQTLNLPFETLYGYYEGAQAIRDDKSLSLEEKALNLQNLAVDTDRNIRGVATAQARAVDDFTRLAQSGQYTSDQLATFATAMNIPNEMNPMWKAETAIKQAEARVKQFEANNLGQPPAEGTVERLNYDKAKLELKIAQAEASKYTNEIPESVLAETLVPEGQSRYRMNGWECAEATNRLTDGPHLTDLFSEKMAFVTHSTNPQVGNVLVTQHGSPNIGHADVVVGFNPVLEQVTVAGYNYSGNGEFSTRKYTLDELNKKYGENWGFTDNTLKTEYREKLDTEMAKVSSANFNPQTTQPSDILKFQSFLDKKAYPAELKTDQEKKQFESQFNQFIDYIKSDNADLNTVLSFSIGGKSLTQSEKEQLLKYEMTADQLDDLQDMIMDVDTGPLLGVFRSNMPYDTKAKQIKAKIISLVPALARGIYGEVGVLTDADVARYTETLPNLTDTKQQKELLLDMTQKMLERGTSQILRNYAAGGSDVSGFGYLISELTESDDLADVDAVINKYNPIKSNLYADYGLSDQ